MHKNRLEAFSDGVFAILITIMVLELKVPHGAKMEDLLPLSHTFFSYILSFIYLAIYWNNHHHLLQIAKHVSGPILWANVHLLFWLSLIPFVTAWSGENQFQEAPVALYGFVLLMCGCAYWILTQCLISKHGKDSELSKAIGKDVKGNVSLLLYLIAIPLSIWIPYLAISLYIVVAIMWLVPDRRIEKRVSGNHTIVP